MGLATSMTIPVVGAFLMFTLMIAPAGTARTLTSNPVGALVLSVAVALAVVWAAIVSSYETNWPIGFFVGVFGLGAFAASQAASRLPRLVRGRSRAAPASAT
jgi:zinc/manganese transport system permease protein